MEPAELFNSLESNQPQHVDDAKKKLQQIFSITKESWLLNGTFDYYLSTNSIRAMEVLSCIKEPHHKYLFDRLCDSLKGPSKVQALGILAHILRRKPPWLYKIVEHQLLREILKLLKNENDILPLLSGLLVVVILLPMVPALIGPFLQDVFDIFSRLAAWNCSNTGRLAEDQLLHLQVTMYALFLRLYGMYPCNFIAYLRKHYQMADNMPVFMHTIRPMLATVRVHPQLIMTSKDDETDATKWKKIHDHDVIVECEKFSLDAAYSSFTSCTSCYHHAYQPFRSRSGTGTEQYQQQQQQLVTMLKSPCAEETDFWSPSLFFRQQSSSPPPTPALLHPEVSAPASIPHTPNLRSLAEGASPPEAAVEATPETTPVKDTRTSRAPVSVGISSSGVARALNRSQPSSPMRKEQSPFWFPPDSSLVSQKILRVVQDRQRVLSVPASPTHQTQQHQDSVGTEDQEVLEIVGSSSATADHNKRCDSVLQEFAGGQEYKTTGEHGSPCASGGLHMADSRSMRAFAKMIHSRRLRHLSHCATTTESIVDEQNSVGRKLGLSRLRRASSCPEVTGAKRRPTACAATQTVELWPAPYEHHLVGVLPLAEQHPQIAIQADSGKDIVSNFSPRELLDRYIEKAAASGTAGSDRSEVDRLKEQLELVHLQLQYERHRREVHAARNRMLLGESRDNRALDEHNAALRDQLSLLQREIEDLHEHLRSTKTEASKREKELQDAERWWNQQYVRAQEEAKRLREQNERLRRELADEKQRADQHCESRRDAEARLFEVQAELASGQQAAKEMKRLKTELDRAKTELLLMGELNQKLKDYADTAAEKSRCQARDEITTYARTCREDVAKLSRQLDSKVAQLEALKAHSVELEGAAAQRDELCTSYKKMLEEVKEGYHEQMLALQSKYDTQRAVNRALEENILCLWQRIELSRPRPTPNVPSVSHSTSQNASEHSPDTSSCQEPPSSPPLSVSLASSSEGSIKTFPAPTEIKNLQELVQHESKPEDNDQHDADITNWSN